MKKLFLIGICVIGGILTSVAQETFTITAKFSGMESDKGDLYVALYNKEGEFLKKTFKGSIVKVNNKTAEAVFENIPKGEYAISCFHDENDNKKMDTRIFGIPKEPIGMSNDAKGFMGPPKYKDAKFLVDKDTEVSINVN
ncbi:DUF2141 domain-containing protein [uncultured Tenacibaculum sp.]|uniref:DUF2141 domain-containing protein n=1 Tax=uncultured Tenacibaculum sp. TaxID=174713 RepID=UPI00261DC371|nr:DUF2141 domain-containing protein [uncultured Tenacibaculum sp.]